MFPRGVTYMAYTERKEMLERKNPYLEIDHIPKSIQVGTGCLLFTAFELAVIHQPFKLLEPLSYQ